MKQKRVNKQVTVNKLTDSIRNLLSDIPQNEIHKVYGLVYDLLLNKHLIEEKKPIVNALYYAEQYVKENRAIKQTENS